MGTTGHELEIINVQDLKASLQKLKDTYIPNLLEIENLASNYTFKKGDHLVLNGVLYKCTAATANTPYTLLVQDGKILYVTINGQKCYVTLNKTLNSGWAKVADIDDKFFVEQRLLDVKKVLDATDTSLDTKINQSIGIAYGACTTAGGTAAKTVTIPTFRLAENKAVSVLFTNAFTTTSPTLNVNGTGAKAITYFGSAIAPGKVRNNTILNMQYDGTAWNVLSIESLAGTPGTAVDLGLPSGLLWCDRNLGAPDPWGQGDYFAWGDIEGHSATTSHLYNQTNYNASAAASINANLSLSYDAARQNLGSPWRMPTKAEFEELMNNCTIEEFEMNDSGGLLFTSNINGNTIFLPDKGYITTQTVSGTEQNVHVPGLHIWTSTRVDATHAWSTYRYSSGQSLILTDEAVRYMARQIRPVM